MAEIYTTRDGDTVEYVAWKYYGRQDGRIVEKVLEANPGIGDPGAVLPYGVAVTLPEIDTSAREDGVKLWD